jgi:hypothetical protein
MEKHEENTKSKEEAEEKAKSWMQDKKCNKSWREDKDDQDCEGMTSKKEQDDEEINYMPYKLSNYSSL